MGNAEEQRVIDAAIKLFPEFFGLRSFTGHKFTLDAMQSFISDGKLNLYVFKVERDGSTVAFSKTTVGELQRNITEVK